jgi:hypothetical protein
MGVTGWLGEAPDEVPPMPVTEMLLARQERRAGPLEVALAGSAANDIREAREAAANAPDPDERAASFVARGVTSRGCSLSYRSGWGTPRTRWRRNGTSLRRPRGGRSSPRGSMPPDGPMCPGCCR